MVDIQLDGKQVSVPEGSMVMHAADAAGTYIPHFCYHKKLSIAANCRMCLVDIEKAPKPMPACATPVTQGMVVRTQSERAKKAQASVMEFLLINHPLDCPICDQGGECQLQDLAVGYGKGASRYTEEKRVVFHKNVGPLISMEEMSRCIQCTRCVRFGQEIAGAMELGMQNRGEHSEIATFVGKTVDSELSGNMIDVCPVGALTSKPFRYSARTWELARRQSVSPHDGVGANLIVQVKNHRVMRVVPQENEPVNECWIADRDRFSYEALNSPERLTSPMIKQGGQWQVVDWATALDYVADGLQRVKAEFGAEGIGALASPHSTLEELHLLAKLTRGLGSEHIDHRLRHADARAAGSAEGARWLGRSIASLTTLGRAFVIGANPRKDQPLLGQRLRQAARHGAQIVRLDAAQEDWAMPVAESLVTAPQRWVHALAAVAVAVANRQGSDAPVPAEAEDASDAATRAAANAIAESLLSGKDKAVLLGNAAAHHPQAAELLSLANWIAEATGATVGYLGEAANSVGAQWAGVQPGPGGKSAAQMLAAPMQGLLLLNVEPGADGGNAAAAQTALQGSGLVVALTSFKDAQVENADVLLPVAPFTETAGTFVNIEGRVQSFHGVVRPLGDTRPAWKVLRVLGNLLGLAGFEQDSVEEVRAEALAGLDTEAARAARLSNACQEPVALTDTQDGLHRMGSVNLYGADALVRRAEALQRTADARAARVVGLPTALWQQMNLAPGAHVRVRQGGAVAVLAAREEATLAAEAVRVPAGVLGALFGPITVEAA